MPQTRPDAAQFGVQQRFVFVTSGAHDVEAHWLLALHVCPLASKPLHTPLAALQPFPQVARITIALAAGNNPRLTCAAYFAITSNTIQFGARAQHREAVRAEHAGHALACLVHVVALEQAVTLQRQPWGGGGFHREAE